MDRIKAYILKNFEQITVLVVLVSDHEGRLAPKHDKADALIDSIVLGMLREPPHDTRSRVIGCHEVLPALIDVAAECQRRSPPEIWAQFTGHRPSDAHAP